MAITGCTTGTGFIAAKTMASAGAHVLMLNRPSQRVDAAAAAIEKEVPGAKITKVECDLMNFASVRSAAQKVLEITGQTGLDVLCNNAGIMALKDEATGDGYDNQMQTVRLAPHQHCCSTVV